MAMVGVGLLWGATNPLLRLGSKSAAETQEIADVQAVSGFWRRLLAPLIDLTMLLMNWRFSIPFIVNQSASVSFILFVMLVSRYPVSIVVPCVNALQFLFTAVVGYLIGWLESVKVYLIVLFLFCSFLLSSEIGRLCLWRHS
ncbi:unnamed protein product [Strongylus vulgaris]|uniref:Transmembrane protein 234 homolog n=1 Tax=Strongylus vulgaris TaxID=40348 RepID=A0A3P7L6F8_STRVU|nr:unnamed protein product [Strongylus vulgaris]